MLTLFLLLEIVCRIAGVGIPERRPPPLSSKYKEVELVAPDGRRSVYEVGRLWLGIPVRLNQDGFRDWRYYIQNRDHAIRVAAIGDLTMKKPSHGPV